VTRKIFDLRWRTQHDAGQNVVIWTFAIYTPLTDYYYGTLPQKGEMDMACGSYGEEEKFIQEFSAEI
jgi:hypothetical protein